METEVIEEKARKMGWVPEDEWRGDPEKWRPAEEFVERGENIVPILKDRLNKLEEEFRITVSAQKAELARVRKEAEEKARAEYETKLRELDEKEAEAVRESDLDTYNKVKKAKENLKPPADTPSRPAENPVFEDWNKKNTWYAPDLNNIGDADEDLTAYANGVAARLVAANPAMSPEDLYKEVENRVKRTFPQKFSNPNRDKADIAASSNNSGPTGKKKKTWSDVPKVDQAAFYRAEKRVKDAGSELKKEDWLKEYFGEEE